MLVREVMSSPVVKVGPEMSLKEATTLLASNDITAMPVVDAAGRLVGVVSEADVLKDAVLSDVRAHELPVRISAGPRLTRVADVMSRHTLTVAPTDDLAEAAELMTSTAVKSLPVIEHGEVVGMVSRRDIIKVIARSDELIEVEVDDLLRISGVDWVVDVKDGVVTVEGPEEEADRELARVLSSTVPGVVAVYVKPGSPTGQGRPSSVSP